MMCKNPDKRTVDCQTCHNLESNHSSNPHPRRHETMTTPSINNDQETNNRETMLQLARQCQNDRQITDTVNTTHICHIYRPKQSLDTKRNLTLLLVTESLTLMAGKRRDPLSCIWYSRFTPVVVSSETPTNLSSILWYFLGFSFIPSLQDREVHGHTKVRDIIMINGSLAYDAVNWSSYLIKNHIIQFPPPEVMEDAGHI
jgi:hypothetical protein